MPFKIDDERMKATNPFMRDGQEVKPVFELRNNEPPLVPIPHMEYPRVVYMHPNEPFRTIEHRNDDFEVVGTERVPTEHLSKKVANEVELKAALDEGWVKEPYIQKAPPNPNAGLYGKRKASDDTKSESGNGARKNLRDQWAT